MSREKVLRDAVVSAKKVMIVAAVRVADRALEGKPLAFGEGVDYQRARHAYRVARQELNQWLCDPERLAGTQKERNK